MKFIKKIFKIILVTLIIILGIIFLYFISQKISITKNTNNGLTKYNLSLYEIISTKLYLKKKYPDKKFEILQVLDQRRISIKHITNEGMPIYKLLLLREKNEHGSEFRLSMGYVYNKKTYAINFFQELILAIFTDIYYKYNPFYKNIIFEDDYECIKRKNEINIENEIKNEVEDIIKKYLKDEEFKIVILADDIVAYSELTTMKDYINSTQETDYYFSTGDFVLDIILIVNNNFSKNNVNIQEYYEICKKILNDLEKSLKGKTDLKNFKFGISLSGVSKNDFQKIKKLSNTMLKEMNFNREAKYNLKKDYDSKIFKEEVSGLFENFK